MGILMLMAMAAPSAHAALLEYFDFENTTAAALFPATPYPADAGQAGVTLRNGPDNPFGSGGIVIDSTGGNPTGVLDLSGITTDCFSFGAINTTGLTDVTLSFDLLSGGIAGHSLSLAYSTTGAAGTFTFFEGIIFTQNVSTYTTFTTPNLDLLIGDHSTLYFEFCLSGSPNLGPAITDHIFIDNIQVTAVPEPTTWIGGALAIPFLVFVYIQRRRRAQMLRRA